MNFADGVCARETLSTWERFWDDCIQTEIRKGQLGAAKPVEQDEDVALMAGGKKGKGKDFYFCNFQHSVNFPEFVFSTKFIFSSLLNVWLWERAFNYMGEIRRN